VQDVDRPAHVQTLPLAFLDELLSYFESVRDVRGDDGRPARRSPEIERLTEKTRALRDAVSAERQKL
jgi:hypothetical protein